MLALDCLQWMLIVNVFLMSNQEGFGPPRMLSDKAELFYDDISNEDFLINNTSVDWNQAKKSCKEHFNATLLSIAKSSDVDLNLLAEILSKASVGEIDTVWIDLQHRVCDGCGNEGYCSAFYDRNTPHRWREGSIVMIPCKANRGFICKIKGRVQIPSKAS